MPEHRHWAERALAAIEADTPAAVLAHVLSWQAGEVRELDDPTDVDDALRAAALYDALGDRFGQGKMLLRAGTVCLSLDDRHDGEDLLRQAQSLLAPFGNTKTLARCLSALASARCSQLTWPARMPCIRKPSPSRAVYRRGLRRDETRKFIGRQCGANRSDGMSLPRAG